MQAHSEATASPQAAGMRPLQSVDPGEPFPGPGQHLSKRKRLQDLRRSTGHQAQVQASILCRHPVLLPAQAAPSVPLPAVKAFLVFGFVENQYAANTSTAAFAAQFRRRATATLRSSDCCSPKPSWHCWALTSSISPDQPYYNSHSNARACANLG